MEKCNVSNKAMENNMVIYKMALINSQMVYIFLGIEPSFHLLLFGVNQSVFRGKFDPMINM